MKRTLSIFLLIFSFAVNAQFSPQDKKLTEKFFPDFDLEINTPAFAKKKGFTTYDELMAFINEKVSAHPELISYTFIGESQKGKKIPLLSLSNGKSDKKKTKVWMQGGLHGNEPASTEGLLYLIDRLLEDPEQQLLLDDIALQIIPMANIDGYEKQDRYAANGLDLNRDQTKLNAPESVSLKQAFSDFGPDVALDFHEYRPFRRDFARMSEWGITAAYDVMFLYSGNLNIPQELRQFTEEEFVNPAKEKIKANGLSSYDYITSTDYHGETHFNLGAVNPRSSATSYALSNCISTLIEVRGVGIGRTSYKRRVFTTFTIAQSYLQSAQAKADQIKQVLEHTENPSAQAIVVKSSRKVRSDKIAVIDIGRNELDSMEVIIRDALHSKATLKRERPSAYLILPGNEAAIAKLKTLGMSIQQLSNDQSMEVEAYTITEYNRKTHSYEGVHPQEVEAKLEIKMVSFPAGTYVISLKQRRSNLSTAVLEPEATSSFIYFEVIKTDLGEELPIYRYLKTKEIQGLK